MPRKTFLFVTLMILTFPLSKGTNPVVAYDIDEAKEICNNLPLDPVEGIWLYPEDKVTVLILSGNDGMEQHSLLKYTISVIESSDTRLSPGEILGYLQATPEAKTYKIELLTERKNELLLKPKSCIATLSADKDVFLIKRQNSGLKGRLNLNFNRLLPGFWKIVSAGISSSGNSNKKEVPVGMIKLHPSYDGNGSSKRKPRYL